MHQILIKRRLSRRALLNSQITVYFKPILYYKVSVVGRVAPDVIYVTWSCSRKLNYAIVRTKEGRDVSFINIYSVVRIEYSSDNDHNLEDTLIAE